MSWCHAPGCLLQRGGISRPSVSPMSEPAPGLVGAPPAWLRCPVCRRILGEDVGGLALIHRSGRRGGARRLTVLAVHVGCSTPRCPGAWTSARYRDAVDAAR